MHKFLAIVLCSALPLAAQSNAIPGVDVNTYDLGDATVYGRRGPAFPNGEVGWNLGHSMCNSGTVAIPWTGGAFNGVMLPTYPKIASLMARESNGRMVQISGKSFCKHSRQAFNFSGGPCGTCQSGAANTWRVNCSDIYSSGFSGLSSLGPTDEIDPWLGTWNPVGSYFDRGDPAVSGPGATDGIRSPITSSDPTYNRMIVPERELLVPGTFWGQVQVSVIGEPGQNRANNATSRAILVTNTGATFSGSITGTAAQLPVLARWTGATVATGRNGLDDGHFMVGCKVTGPVDGFWHYEIAVHNLDNASGAAALRIPLCATARVRNTGFRDIDGNALNEWQVNRTSNELAWLAPAGNSLDWNTIYNVWFDCDTAPVAGSLAIDRARLGPGALSIAVGAQVPGELGQEFVAAGCGNPAPELFSNGLPTVPNATYALQVRGTASAANLFALSFGSASGQLGGGCVQLLDGNQLLGTQLVFADPAGLASFAVPIPAGMAPIDLFGQVVQFVPGGPLFGGAALSNGLRLRLGGLGCP